jgi:hypothetical protein
MRTREILRQARIDGREVGQARASWAWDGNTADDFFPRVLAGITDGDPEVLDAFNVPNLSGEWAGDPTPSTLADDYGIDERRDPDGSLLDEVCQAWEEAAANAFWDTLEKDCQWHVDRLLRNTPNRTAWVVRKGLNGWDVVLVSVDTGHRHEWAGSEMSRSNAERMADRLNRERNAP